MRSLFFVVLIGTGMLLTSGAGCSLVSSAESDRDRAEEAGIAEVDSIHVSPQTGSTDTLSVRLLGTVGPNGCYSFDRFDVERTPDRLTITPIVQRITADDIACTMALVPLDETYHAQPPFSTGALTIRVPQADRPDVTTTVEVVSEE